MTEPIVSAPGPSSPEPQASAGRSRRGHVIGLAALAVALLVVAAAAIPLLVTDEKAPSPTLDAVVVLEDLANDHVTGDVDYERQPPAGGPHDGAWQACGVYDEPLRDENVVHSLEHGTVWLTHRPDLTEEEVNSLAAALPDEGILSPYPDQEAPVVVTVWGRQLELTGADDPRLRLFLDEYADGHTSPEASASCEGGLRDAGDGSVAA